MPGPVPLTVHVTDALSLDLGRVTPVSVHGEVVRLVEPPKAPLIEQLVRHLEELPRSSQRRRIPEAAVGLALLTVRWGSYYALLADPNRPEWEHADQANVSHLTDAEMKRVNIEASHALSTLVDLCRRQPERFWNLLGLAYQHLPRTRARARIDPSSSLRLYRVLADPHARQQILADADVEALDRGREYVGENPRRVFANALIHGCWRNGPIDSLHAGQVPDALPVTRSRIRPARQRGLFGRYCDGLGHGLVALQQLTAQDDVDWETAALPFHLLASTPGVHLFAAPPSWSLTATSADVQLPGTEPAG